MKKYITILLFIVIYCLSFNVKAKVYNEEDYKKLNVKRAYIICNYIYSMDDGYNPTLKDLLLGSQTCSTDDISIYEIKYGKDLDGKEIVSYTELLNNNKLSEFPKIDIKYLFYKSDEKDSKTILDNKVTTIKNNIETLAFDSTKFESLGINRSYIIGAYVFKIGEDANPNLYDLLLANQTNPKGEAKIYEIKYTKDINGNAIKTYKDLISGENLKDFPEVNLRYYISGNNKENQKEDIFEKIKIKYKVIHQKQNLDNDDYTTIDEKEYEGNYHEEVTPPVMEYNGFTPPETKTIKLETDTEITYLYTRNSYKVSYKYDGDVPENAKELPDDETYLYGAKVNVIDNPVLSEYTFSGWSMKENFEMPDHDVLITGSFTPSEKTAKYRIEYYYQSNGKYEKESKSVEKEADINTIVSLSKDDKTPIYDNYVLDDKADNHLSGRVVANKANWSWPTKTPYKISSGIGYRWGSLHRGIDIIGPGAGSPIYAADKGVVISKGYDGSRGNYIIINHENGYYTQYMHLEESLVSKGDIVTNHQTIGKMGCTGSCTGPHLHFEIWDGVPYSTGAKFYDARNIIGKEFEQVLKVYFKEQFSVTYKKGSNGTFEEITINNLNYNDDTPEPPEVTCIDGYHFIGWSPNKEDKVTKTIIYEAQYEKDKE